MFVASYVSSIGALVLLWLVYPKARPSCAVPACLANPGWGLQRAGRAAAKARAPAADGMQGGRQDQLRATCF
jgi:hypothetical protein